MWVISSPYNHIQDIQSQHIKILIKYIKQTYEEDIINHNNTLIYIYEIKYLLIYTIQDNYIKIYKIWNREEILNNT